MGPLLLLLVAALVLGACGLFAGPAPSSGPTSAACAGVSGAVVGDQTRPPGAVPLPPGTRVQQPGRTYMTALPPGDAVAFYRGLVTRWIVLRVEAYRAGQAVLLEDRTREYEPVVVIVEPAGQPTGCAAAIEIEPPRRRDVPAPVTAAPGPGQPPAATSDPTGTLGGSSRPTLAPLVAGKPPVLEMQMFYPGARGLSAKTDIEKRTLEVELFTQTGLTTVEAYYQRWITVIYGAAVTRETLPTGGVVLGWNMPLSRGSVRLAPSGGGTNILISAERRTGA